MITKKTLLLPVLFVITLGAVFLNYQINASTTSTVAEANMSSTKNQQEPDETKGALSQLIDALRPLNGESTEPTPTPLPDGALLPDMIVLPPRSLYLTYNGDIRNLRFSTTFVNQGDGPMEFIGTNDPKQEITIANQQIYLENGNKIEHFMGEFVLHPTHRHWHVGEYVMYELWQIDENNEPTTIVSQTEKMSFCIWDEHRRDMSLPNARQTQVYTSNCQNNVQGMSVGWSDTYQPSTDGQQLDVSQVADGRYLFRSIVNPGRLFHETNYDNNTSDIGLELIGNNLRLFEL